MQSSNSREIIPAVEGKVLSSAFIVNEDAAAHGVLLVFTDGSELSINFDHQVRVSPEVLRYRWDNEEEVMLDETTGL